jgi:hypothetical protein
VTRQPVRDAVWSARVVDAGVRLDLFESADDDYAFALLGLTITRAVSEAALSDDDAYPLLVRYWNGTWPEVGWPQGAPAVARLCAMTLAERGGCAMERALYAPTDASLQAARDAIIAELGLTQRDLLAALAEHWKQIDALEMPTGRGCSLLAFARHVLLEPLVGACALIWSTLDSSSSSSTPAAEAVLSWDEWSPIEIDDWGGVVAAELARLGRPAQDLPADGDEWAGLLAAARSTWLGAHDGAALVAASIVRTSGWPGETDIIDPIAASAVDRALEHVDEIDPETDNEELVDRIQGLVLPGDDVLMRLVRDTSFGTLRDHAVSARTGAEMLRTAADWLTWSIAHEAVEAVAAIRRPPGSTALT